MYFVIFNRILNVTQVKISNIMNGTSLFEINVSLDRNICPFSCSLVPQKPEVHIIILI